MTLPEILKSLSGAFKDAKFELVEGVKHPVTGTQVGDSLITVPAEKIKEVCKKLKQDSQFDFDCLSNLTAVDRKDRFEVVYHLFSYRHLHSLELKLTLPRDDNARVDSLEEIWGCANWLEREVYDLFGVRFDGHSDLRRIMLPDDWVGHPLRKDYKEQEDYHGITTTRPSPIQ